MLWGGKAELRPRLRDRQYRPGVNRSVESVTCCNKEDEA